MQKSKKKGLKAVNSPQVKNERTFHVNLLVENFCVDFQNYMKLTHTFKIRTRENRINVTYASIISQVVELFPEKVHKKICNKKTNR